MRPEAATSPSGSLGILVSTQGSVSYSTDAAAVVEHDLEGFFVDWPRPPSPKRRLAVLRGSHRVVLARDQSGQLVGFVTAISDDALSAYIPLLEILPGFQGRGIGSELMRRMLAELEGLYMIDLCCDAELQPYYERFGMQPAVGMILRRPMPAD